MQDYYPHNTSPTALGQNEKSAAKMTLTLETEAEETDIMALTHRYLKDPSDDLKQHFTLLLDQKLESFSKQMSSLTNMIKDVSLTVNAAYDLNKSLEQHIKEL